MTTDAPSAIEPATPLDQRARLRAALAFVAEMAGGKGLEPETEADAAARGHAYARANAVARRRFDALTAEAGAFAAAGIAALIHHREAKNRDCASAAAQLAVDMRRALAAMDRLIPLR